MYTMTSHWWQLGHPNYTHLCLCFAHLLAYFVVHCIQLHAKIPKIWPTLLKEGIHSSYPLCPFPHSWLSPSAQALHDPVFLHPFPLFADKTSKNIGCISVYLSIHLFIYLPTDLSVCLPAVCVSIYLSISLSVFLDSPTTTLKFIKISPLNHNPFH